MTALTLTQAERIGLSTLLRADIHTYCTHVDAPTRNRLRARGLVRALKLTPAGRKELAREREELQAAARAELATADVALLTEIARVLSEDGRCHTGDVASTPEDSDVLDALQRAGCIDTDLCGHCDSSTCHVLTDVGLALVPFRACVRCEHLFSTDGDRGDRACCSDHCAEDHARERISARAELHHDHTHQGASR